MLRLFTNRPFTMVWLAGLVSVTGDWLLITGLPIYVFTVTGSSLVTSTVFICELLPVIATGSVIGVVVDRWDRRRMLVAVSVAQAALVPALLAVQSVDRLWVVYVVVAGNALLSQFVEPTKNALLPDLVPAGDVVAANGLVSLSTHLARLIGGALGGVAVVSGTLVGVALGDMLSFLIAAGLFLAAGRAAHAASRQDVPAGGQAWRDGLLLVVRSRKLRSIFLGAAAIAFAQGMFVVLFVVFVSRMLHGDAAEIGLLRGVQAGGAIAGGVLLAVFGARLASRRMAVLGAFGYGLLAFVVWNGPALDLSFGSYIGLFVALGVPNILLTTGMTVFVQRTVAGSHLGRVFATFFAMWSAFEAGGMLLAGLLGDSVDVVALLNGHACLFLLGGGVLLVGLRDRAAAPVAEPVLDETSRR